MMMTWTRQLGIVLFVIMLAAKGCNSATQPSATAGKETAAATEAKKEADATSSEEGRILSVNAKEFYQLIREHGKEIPVIDVRTPEEYQQGYLPNAININLYDERFKEKILKAVGEQPAVMVYCRSGRRSLQAAKILKEMGYRKIYNLRGGILEWTESGLPVLE